MRKVLTWTVYIAMALVAVGCIIYIVHRVNEIIE